MSKKKTNTKKLVMEKIIKEQVKMKPKLYFVGGSLMLGMGLIILVLTSSLVIDVISFKLSAMNARGMVNLGWWGWKMMARTIPWNLVFLASLLVGLGVNLMKRYEFSYKKGLVWIAVGMVLGVIGLSFLIGKLDVRRRLPVPSVERLYQTKELPPKMREEMIEKGWRPGEVRGVMKQNIRPSERN